MRKKEKKELSIKTIVLLIFVIFFLTMGIAYSYLKQSLNVTGKTTLAPQLVNGYMQGNSTYTYQILETTKDIEKNEKIYKVKLNILNMDKDIGNWKVSFDVPNSYNDINSQVITNCYKTCKNNRITLTALNDEFVAKGDFLQIEMQIALSSQENLYIENVVLNDLAVKSN